MKVYCKRTFFKVNKNFYPVNKSKYLEEYVCYKKGKTYECKKPSELENEFGIALYIQSEVLDSFGSSIYKPVTKKEFEKYFLDIKENRNNKINEILNRQ